MSTIDLAAARPGHAPPTVVPTRWVDVLCDEPGSAAPWLQALASEGLGVRLRRLGPPLADTEPRTAEGARVLFLARPLTEHLGLLRDWRALDAARPLLTVLQGLRDLDHVLALEMGADDVLDATVPAPVVAAHLRALWRRCRPHEQQEGPETLHFGRLTIGHRERTATLDGRRIELTEAEFEVLWMLASRAGQPVTRYELLKHTRGLAYERHDRSIDSRVYRIRSKLGDLRGDAQRIRTVRNCGYLFTPLGW